MNHGFGAVAAGAHYSSSKEKAGSIASARLRRGLHMERVEIGVC